MISPVAIAEHAARAGWRGGDLIVAVAVAMAESGGRETAHNTSRGADARGIWQVNVAHDAHPDLASLNLYDPATNAKAAYGIWKAGGWGPWQAHNNRTYVIFMPIATAVASAPSVLGIVAAGVVDDVASKIPGKDMLDAARGGLKLGIKAGGWLSNRNNWVRVAYVMLGTGLMWGGLLMVVGKPVMSTTEAVAGGLLGTREAGAAIKATKATGGAK